MTFALSGTTIVDARAVSGPAMAILDEVPMAFPDFDSGTIILALAEPGYYLRAKSLDRKSTRLNSSHV